MTVGVGSRGLAGRQEGLNRAGGCPRRKRIVLAANRLVQPRGRQTRAIDSIYLRCACPGEPEPSATAASAGLHPWSILRVFIAARARRAECQQSASGPSLGQSCMCISR
jgi:hypothetical protein